MFAELLAHDGVVEQLELRSNFGFMAFHGGSLERVTEVVASEAAEAAGASYYGVLQPADFRWHIPSKLIRPADSEHLAAFLSHVDVAVAVHGYGREDMWTTILLGGRNRSLARHLGAHLDLALDEYRVVDELDQVPLALRGQHPDNPANLPQGGGVQLELPPRVRGMGPVWADWSDGLTPHTESLIAALVNAATSWRSVSRRAQARTSDNRAS